MTHTLRQETAESAVSDDSRRRYGLTPAATQIEQARKRRLCAAEAGRMVDAFRNATPATRRATRQERVAAAQRTRGVVAVGWTPGRSRRCASSAGRRITRTRARGRSRCADGEAL